MSLFDAFRFDGKRVLVVGGATGMGAAAAELARDAGADVVVMDYADIALDGVTKIQVNLGDVDSINSAIDECGGPIHAIMSAAGIADGPNIEKINFLGHRHLIDRAVAAGMVPAGSAICFISSAAGLGWENNFAVLREALDIDDTEKAAQWFVDNGKADYFHTKQAVCAYVSYKAFDFMKKGIRINALCPGPTDTPLAQANKETWLGFGADYREDIGVPASTPMDQAYPLLFLCSEAGAVISGQTIVSDVGLMASGVTGSYPNAVILAQMLYGRSTEGVEMPEMPEG